MSQAASKLLPSELAIETFNSQYLQRHPGSPRATLAIAKSLRILGAPVEEIEGTIFGLTHPEANLDVDVSYHGIFIHDLLFMRPFQTALASLSFLKEISSSRVDEFRAACDGLFQLSTVFKTPSEIAALRKQAVAPPPDGPVEQANGVEPDVTTN